MKLQSEHLFKDTKDDFCKHCIWSLSFSYLSLSTNGLKKWDACSEDEASHNWVAVSHEHNGQVENIFFIDFNLWSNRNSLNFNLLNIYINNKLTLDQSKVKKKEKILSVIVNINSLKKIFIFLVIFFVLPS